MTTWRLLRADVGSGAWQMGVDAAVLEARSADRVPATVRLYRFNPPCATIGHFQDAGDVDVAWCIDRGIEVARRPTGGRGVLHDDEVTYSVVAATVDGVPRGVKASYRHFCAALLEAYELLGVPAKLTRRDRGTGSSSACYLHATPADVSCGTAKLSGSAQVWRAETVLQHGSFVLSRDVVAEAAVFRLSPDQQGQLGSTTVALDGALGGCPPHGLVEDAVVEGFQRALGIRLVEGVLTRAERVRAAALEREYAVARPSVANEHQGFVKVEGV